MDTSVTWETKEAGVEFPYCLYLVAVTFIPPPLFTSVIKGYPAMFTWINSQGVRSNCGFEVEGMSRFTIEYREDNNKITIEVENGFIEGRKPCVIIERSVFERWDGDPSYVTLPLEKQEEIMNNFVAAMQYQGIAVVVEPARFS